jgi:hypothetical protein
MNIPFKRLIPKNGECIVLSIIIWPILDFLKEKASMFRGITLFGFIKEIQKSVG